MPEICRFLSIIIKMHYDEHQPPHFHAEYQGQKALFDIRTGEKMKGKFPKNKLIFVKTWSLLRQRELLENWKAIETEKSPLR